MEEKEFDKFIKKLKDRMRSITSTDLEYREILFRTINKLAGEFKSKIDKSKRGWGRTY